MFKFVKNITIKGMKTFAEKYTEGSILQEKTILYASCPSYLKRSYLRYAHTQQISKWSLWELFYVHVYMVHTNSAALLNSQKTPFWMRN